MVLLGIIFVVWFISPFVLVPLLIASKIKQKDQSEELMRSRGNEVNLADRVQELFEENKKLTQKLAEAENSAVQAEAETQFGRGIIAQQEETAEGDSKTSAVSVEATDVPGESVAAYTKEIENIAKSFDNASTEEKTTANVNTDTTTFKPYTASYATPSTVYTKPQKTAEEKKVSTISIMLTLGAILISIAGIVFATTSWNSMGNAVKSITVLSFSFIFFILSIIAEKIGIPKTGKVFYSLGSIFLPITVIAAGYFSLFGEWFSFSGDGQPILWACALLLYAIAAFIGVVKYSSKIFAWSSLLAASSAVCSLIGFVAGAYEIFTLAVAVYALAITASVRLVKTSDNGALSVYSRIYAPFATINLLLLSLSSLGSPFTPGYTVPVIIAAVLFAAAWFISKPVVEERSVHAVPFALFLTIALVKPMMDSDISCIVFMLCTSAAVNIAISFIPSIKNGFGEVLRWIAGIMEIPLLAACVICSIFDSGIMSIFGLIIILGVVGSLWLFNKTTIIGTVCKGFIPVVLECLIFSILYEALDGIGDEGEFICFGLVSASLILTALFTFIKRLELQSIASDIVFGTTAVSAALIVGFFGGGQPLLAIIGLFMAAVTVFIPCVSSEEKYKKYVCTAFAAAVVAMLPFILVEQYDLEEHTLLVFLLTAFAMGAVATVSLVLTRNEESPVVANTYSLVTLTAVAYYGVSRVAEEKACLFFLVPLVIFVCLKYIKPYNNKLSSIIREVSKYCLFGMNLLFLGEMLIMDEFTAFGFVFCLIIAALSVYFAYGSKNNTYAIATIGVAMVSIVRYSDTLVENAGIQYALIAILFALSLVPSVLLHKDALFSKNEEKFTLDIFTVTRPLLIILLYAVAYNDTARWFCTLFTGAVILTFVRSGFKIIVNQCIACVAAFSLVIAWMSQPFFEWPDIIDLEMRLLPIIVYFGVMVFVWADTVLEKATEIAMFVVSAFCYFVLVVQALNTEEPVDALIITVSATIVFIYSFIVKKKKWFLLGGIIVLGMVFRMTRDFWASLDWWIYLLVAGLVFLGLGIGNEVRKKRAESRPADAPVEKKTRFMSDWTW